jgi:hypothetical protein
MISEKSDVLGAIVPPRSSMLGNIFRSLSDRSSGSEDCRIASAYVMVPFTSSASSDWFIDCMR